MKTRFLLVDDHPLVRGGLRRALEKEADWEVAAEAGEPNEALAQAKKYRPDFIIMDLQLPGMNGLMLTRRIRDILPEVKVIIFSALCEAEFVSEAIKMGVNGYILKETEASQLVRSIRSVLQGRVELSPEVTTVLAEVFKKSQTAPGAPEQAALSDRESEVLKLLVDGRNTKEIAETLDISIKSVETYRLRVMEKLNIHNLADLVKHAIRSGLYKI